MDFDDAFPDFDPASFDDKYPSKDDYPGLYWNVAMRRVYDYELYQMARDSGYCEEMRELARRAWQAIELNDVGAFATDLAGQLLDTALDKDNGTLHPLMVSTYLSVMLWTVFRESGESEWLQSVLHRAIGFVDMNGDELSVAQAFVAGWAAGCVDGTLEEGHRVLGDDTPME